MKRLPIPITLETGETRARLIAAGFRLDHRLPGYLQPVRGTILYVIPQQDVLLYEQRDYFE